VDLLDRFIASGDAPEEAIALRDTLADRLRQRRLDELP